MGPIDSPFSRCGVEITDSAYVVLNMKIMTRMGRAALERIARDGSFVRGLHSTGELDPERRFIMHFPEELSIKSFGSGLRRQCAARQEMPRAAHRQLAGAHRRLARRAHADRRHRKSAGEIHYVACAFPSACGKTNLAMLIPPASYARLEGLDRRR
jgi:phosphoenolpyruvate carboxykinase (GTP)